jgi:glycosyltransferase involved in cell wall biosynthesis
MRVLFLNQYYRPDPAATAQLLTDLAEYLAAPEQGCEVHVVCSRREYAGTGTRLPVREVHNGVHIQRVDAPIARFTATNSRTARLADFAAFGALALARCLSLPRPDVCVAMTSPPFVASLGVVLKRLRSTRLLLWMMDLYPDIASALGAVPATAWSHRLADRLGHVIYRHAERIITPGYAMTERLCRAGIAAEKLDTVPNWSPNERMPRPTTSRADGPFRILYSGHLGLAHEFDTVLDAASHLRNRRDLRITFAGRGPRREALMAETRRRGLDNVTFESPQDLDRLPEFLASADLHLVTMREKAQGLVVPSKLYGILAAGRPAVFVGPAHNEVSRTLDTAGAGWTVAPGDGIELARHVTRLAADRALADRMGRQARRYYETHCTRHVRCRHLAHLIRHPA